MKRIRIVLQDRRPRRVNSSSKAGKLSRCFLPGPRLHRPVIRLGMPTVLLWGLVALASADSASASGSNQVSSKVVPNSGTGDMYVQVVSAAGVPVYSSGGGLGPVPGPPAPFRTGPLWFPKFWPGGASSGLFFKAPGTGYDLSGTVTGTLPIPLPTPPPSATADAHQLVTGATVNLSAYAYVNVQTSAAARSGDPEYFGPGFNTLHITLSDISISSDTTSSAIFGADAGSSISGLEHLYGFGVYASGPIHSLSDVTVGFFSNPLLGLNDSAIDADILAHMSVSGDTATLNSPVSFDINLYSQDSYSVSSSASASVVLPGPPAIAPMLLGLVRLGRRRRR